MYQPVLGLTNKKCQSLIVFGNFFYVSHQVMNFRNSADKSHLLMKHCIQKEVKPVPYSLRQKKVKYIYSHSLKAKNDRQVTKKRIPILSSTTLTHLTFLSLQEGDFKGITPRSNTAFQKGNGIHMNLFSQGGKEQALHFMNE